MGVFLAVFEKISIASEPAPAQKLSDVLATISHMQLTPTNYLLASEQDAKKLYELFAPTMQTRDRFYLFPLANAYFGKGRPDVWAWLVSNGLTTP
jgi:hypothetical protein